ncbi:MAG TPA: POTRA domain-containing protein [Candidatus Cloacimonadota bacterium]|mgnify:CR=1 FL=1|nr:POTRA domain-containing protein [Candidatus Cloacimonadota bacterium]HPT71126.1 POTRA domain-containing protein [Candidatus Cloacimonadota bacterium]
MPHRFLFTLIVLFIISGLCAEVKIISIDFQGNLKIDSRDLLNQLTMRPGMVFESDILKSECESLKQYYDHEGFYQAVIHYPEVIPINAETVRILFTIDENGKSIITKLALSGNRYFPLVKLQNLLGFTDESTWTFSEISPLLQQIQELYTSRSYLFASVNLDSLRWNSDGYTAFITVNEGKLCHITNYRFQGNKTTKPSILIKLSGLDQVTAITPAVISQAEENIRSKEYIKNCTIIPLDESTLLITIDEDKMTKLAGVLGYNNANVKSTQRLSGNVQFQFMNLWGTDRNLSFEWYQLQDQHKTLELSYHESGPSRIPLAGDISLYREQADSTWLKNRLSLSMYYYLLYHQFGINLGTDDVYPGSRRPMLIANDHEKTVGVFWKFVNVDYGPNPSTGMTAYATFNQIYVNTDSIDTKRNAVTFAWDNYHTVLKRLVWFLGMNGKHLSDKEAPYTRLYRLGGFNSLRGFMENSYSGWRVGWINNELRLRTGRDSRVHLFLDYGYVEYRHDVKDHILDNLWGTGVGIRVNTRLGVMGIDYALGYNGKKWTSPMDGIIHFGIDSKF